MPLNGSLRTAISIGGLFLRESCCQRPPQVPLFYDETWPVGMAAGNNDDAGCSGHADCKGVSHFLPGSGEQERTRERTTGVGQQQPGPGWFCRILFYLPPLSTPQADSAAGTIPGSRVLC